MQGFWNPPQFTEGASQRGDLVSSLESTDQFGRSHGSHLQRSRDAEKLIPVRRHELAPEIMPRHSLQHTVVLLPLKTPEPRVTYIGQTRTELKSQEPEQAKHQIGIAGRVRDDLLRLQFG